MIKLNFSLKILVLKIIWSHEHSCHIIKTIFSNDSAKNFPGFFKISVSLKFDQSKCEGEKWLFLLKIPSPSIPFDQSSLFSCVFRFLLDSSWPIKFQFFKNKRESDLIFFKRVFVYLFNSSLDPSSQKKKKKKCRVCGQSFKTFLHLLKVRLF